MEAITPITHALGTFETLHELRYTFFGSLKRVSDKWNLLREHRSQRSLMHRVREHIEQQYGNGNLSLQLLSEEFGISKNYLSRLFKDEFGENFIDYVADVRMQHARRLLEETSLSIQEIAAQVGYEHYFTFNRAFKKTTGFPPSDFRKKQEM
ncbi:helix-turn-helix transcriptional regulator [Paenibacillus cremeus]|nr:AraC family transcriptional regulator [Paenibacillus cremeus]